MRPTRDIDPPRLSSPIDTQELYTTAFGSLLVLLLSWQIAKVGDVFWRRSVQFIRKNLLQTLLVTRRAGSSDYTVDVGVQSPPKTRDTL